MDEIPQAKSVEIYVSNTYFKIKCSPGGFLENGIHIDSFLWTLTESVFDPRIKCFYPKYKYCYYDSKTGMIHFPRYVLDSFIDYINCPFICTSIAIKNKKNINVKMKSKYNDKPNQKEIMDYLGEREGSVKLLEASTGIGKTYCAIKASLVIHGKVTIFQTSGLVEHWYKELLSKTNLDAKDIYIIQGRDSLVKLFKKPKIKPKCFVASLQTLYAYALGKEEAYKNLKYSYEEFLDVYDVDIKVTDEVHLNFYMNVVIDLKTDIHHYINLSATYGRSNYQGNRIFNNIYPKELRFGNKHIERYTDVFMYNYSLGPYMTRVRLIGKNGYMQIKYEQKVCRNTLTKYEFLDKVIQPLIDSHYINYKQLGEKLLILTSTTAMANEIATYVRENYTDNKVVTYFSGDKEEKLDDCDVVVSTLGSSGTGRDIKNLITTININSFKSEILANQCMGRLRKIPERTTIFVDMYNRDLFSHVEHKKRRIDAYRTKCKNFTELRIN